MTMVQNAVDCERIPLDMIENEDKINLKLIGELLQIPTNEIIKKFIHDGIKQILEEFKTIYG